jgi:hypothetical protein
MAYLVEWILVDKKKGFKFKHFQAGAMKKRSRQVQTIAGWRVCAPKESS